MGSNARKRTTAAKLNREGKLRQKRYEKELRKAERKLAVDDDVIAAPLDPEPETPEGHRA